MSKYNIYAEVSSAYAPTTGAPSVASLDLDELSSLGSSSWNDEIGYEFYSKMDNIRNDIVRYEDDVLSALQSQIDEINRNPVERYTRRY